MRKKDSRALSSSIAPYKIVACGCRAQAPAEACCFRCSIANDMCRMCGKRLKPLRAQVATRLPQELYVKLERRAREERKNVSTLLREAVRSFLTGGRL